MNTMVLEATRYLGGNIVHRLVILKDKEIIPIGRFGHWDYLWSDQAFMSGYEALKQDL